MTPNTPNLHIICKTRKLLLWEKEIYFQLLIHYLRIYFSRYYLSKNAHPVTKMQGKT